MTKYRVWWIPQVGVANGTFYIPVNSPEEGKKMLDVLAYYDLFQLQHNIKPDFCNTGGLEMWDDETNEWCDWILETDEEYFDDLDEYCESDCCKEKDALNEFAEYMVNQIDFDALP